MVNMDREAVILTRRGVWHALWESLTTLHCPAANPTRLRVRDLLAFCPEIGIEYARAFPDRLHILDIEKPAILSDPKTSEAWIRFSIHRGDFKSCEMSGPALMSQIRTARSGYVEVKSEQKDYRTFQTSTPATVGHNQHIPTALTEDLRGMNLFTHLGNDHQLRYFLAAQDRLPLRLPQIMVLYTILFWLGSLVRYDPHSVAHLMDSQYWFVIDGFMSQSRLWLLEQFEWAVFEAETTLWVAR
jgi:hypothetical protein